MMQRFQHILIPVDFTEKKLPALEISVDLAVANRARVTLLHPANEPPLAEPLVLPPKAPRYL